MGLDLIPEPDPCVELERFRDLPGVSIVFTGFKCPLSGVSKHNGMLGNTCWCRGKVVAAELDALGYADVAEQLYSDKNEEEAIELGAQLTSIAEVLRRKYDGKAKQPRGAGWNLTYDNEAKKWNAGSHSSFDEAVAAIEDAGRWYTAVGKIGSRVVAWS